MKEYEYVVTLFEYCDDNDFISCNNRNGDNDDIMSLCCQVVAHKMGSFDLPQHYGFTQKKYWTCVSNARAVFKRTQKEKT